MSRQIVGILYKFDGLTPWTGARLVFSLLTDTAAGADAAWPVWSKTVTAGDDGAIPAETKLDTPPSGSWKYRLKIEENTPLDFYLEQGDGSDLSISDIVALAGVAGSEAGTPQGEFLNGLYALVAGAADGRLLETAGGGLALTDAPLGTAAFADTDAFDAAGAAGAVFDAIRPYYAGLLSPTYLSITSVSQAYVTAVGAAVVAGASATIYHGGVYYAGVYDAGLPGWRIFNYATGAVTALIDYVAKVVAYSPIAYWPMIETTGTTADNAEGTSARDGTYSGVTLSAVAGPDGNPAPQFDGVNDYLNIYTASLIAALNMQEISVSAWIKARASSIWSDGADRRGLLLRVNANNQLALTKNAAAGQFEFRYAAAGTAKVVTKTSVAATGWVHLGLTVSLSNNRAIAYWNGAQEGATQTGLGTFAGALDSSRVAIGCDNTVTPALVWDGYIAHVAIFGSELSAANMLALATVNA